MKEMDRVPGYQRVLIVDEVDDPENPGKKIAVHQETTADNYVEVMGKRLAEQQQDTEKQRNALATHNLSLQTALAEKDTELERLRAELARLQNPSAPEGEPTPASSEPAGGPSEPETPVTPVTPADESKDLDLNTTQTGSLAGVINDGNKKGKGGK